MPNTTRDDTVVAVFANADEAGVAERELLAAGFAPGRIYSSAALNAEEVQHTPEHHQSGFTGWLKSLFGAEDDAQSHPYRTAFSNGQAIVSVVTSEADADRASAILSRLSPIDVHTDEFGTARGISTPDTESAAIEPSQATILNVEDEMRAELKKTGIRVYPGTGTKS